MAVGREQTGMVRAPGHAGQLNYYKSDVVLNGHVQVPEKVGVQTRGRKRALPLRCSQQQCPCCTAAAGYPK